MDQRFVAGHAAAVAEEEYELMSSGIVERVGSPVERSDLQNVQAWND